MLLAAAGAACGPQTPDAHAFQSPKAASSTPRSQVDGAAAAGVTTDSATSQRGTTIGEDTLTFGHFGRVVLYRRTEQPANVVLFISGDGGWNLGVVDMARELSTMDALV